eukprot:TRINITY_DN1627_c0_g1_i8.p1 TRINITY_DN1627_c0_g1~~TRINITY_DN1627_c0_g1_i8.p1  ORF type:complete len:218 (+),score=18.03 TRINITY_DN1627_c0_g1_i8:60-713(+)
MEDPVFLKVLVVGDSGVGKTSLLNKYCYNRFDNSVKPTIGCDFTLKAFDDFQGKKIRLQLWDIAGQERFHSVSKLYLRGAVGCIVVCDIQNEESMNNCLRWKKIVEENADIPQDIANARIPMILLQNKVDLLKEINEPADYMKSDNVKEFAKNNNFDEAYQVSAKENINIDESIEFLLDQILSSELLKIRTLANEQDGQIKNLKDSTHLQNLSLIHI